MTGPARRPRRHIVREVEGPSCACTPDTPCLFHYDQLDPCRQAGARRRAGVHGPYLGARR
jgi:hypothetical protein